MGQGCRKKGQWWFGVTRECGYFQVFFSIYPRFLIAICSSSLEHSAGFVTQVPPHLLITHNNYV
jgi:hypothetical protein